MLAVSALRDTSKDGKQGEMEAGFNAGDFPDFGDGNLLESIDFDDLFAGINDGDMLPDLEMDPEIMVVDFSISGGEESDINSSEKAEQERREEEDKVSGLGSTISVSNKDDEIMSKRDEAETKLKPAADKENEKARKSGGTQSKNNNNNQGKRKVKVDWTPDLHRRFVQAVEQLGVDKAVPSRILELMGIDCLTRHNIASHLQKYRSHRKHLLAREAEAASWSQKRQIYGGGKRDNHMSPWVAPPTMGFPPNPMHHQFRPLHVWGHPSMDPNLMHMWPKHLAPPTHHSPPPPQPWAPQHPPPSDPSFWHHHRVPNGLTPGTPCFPQPLPAATRFPAPPVPGIPPPHPHAAMYKVDPPATAQSTPQPIVDFHPSNESIDAAIGDVLLKPWLPLPLGLKPPSMDSVMGELQRQGVPKVPPCT